VLAYLRRVKHSSVMPSVEMVSSGSRLNSRSLRLVNMLYGGSKVSCNGRQISNMPTAVVFLAPVDR